MEKKTRFTSKIKTEAVLSLLRGESIEAVARKYGVTIADLNFWRDQFIEHGADGFKRRPDDSRLKEAQRMIGKLQMELELTKKKNELVARLKRR
jgi:transposase